MEGRLGVGMNGETRVGLNNRYKFFLILIAILSIAVAVIEIFFIEGFEGKNALFILQLTYLPFFIAMSILIYFGYFHGRLFNSKFIINQIFFIILFLMHISFFIGA